MSVEAAFPTPPSYYKRYAAWTQESVDAALQPPPPLPLDDPLMVFGALAFPPPNEINKPHLNAEPKPQLYPTAESIDVVSELKKLNRALVFNFLELLEVLVKNPTLFQKKVDDLEVIFVNMHHLLNSFRPHQARSYIISVLEEQVTKKKNAVASLRSTFANVETTMQQLSNQIEKEATLPAVAARSEVSAMEVDAQPAKPAAAAAELLSVAPFEEALAALKEQLDKIPVGAVGTLAASVVAEQLDEDDDEVKVTIKLPGTPRAKK